MSSRSTRTSTCPKRSCSTPDGGGLRPPAPGRLPRIILGIDPGTTGMGYAFLVAAPERALLLECGIVDVRASSSAAGRLLAISKALDELIRRHRPAQLAVQRPVLIKKAPTSMPLSEAR